MPRQDEMTAFSSQIETGLNSRDGHATMGHSLTFCVVRSHRLHRGPDDGLQALWISASSLEPQMGLSASVVSVPTRALYRLQSPCPVTVLGAATQARAKRPQQRRNQSPTVANPPELCFSTRPQDAHKWSPDHNAKAAQPF